MRTITEIIIHCTATEAERDVTIEEIDRWHHARGWKSCGYHFIIHQDGSIDVGRPISEAGAHCKGHNAHSIGIAYVGGMLDGKPSDTRTFEQIQSLVLLTKTLCRTFTTITEIKGHNEYCSKKCPCFNVKAFCLVNGLIPFNMEYHG